MHLQLARAALVATDLSASRHSRLRLTKAQCAKRFASKCAASRCQMALGGAGSHPRGDLGRAPLACGAPVGAWVPRRK